MNVKINNFYDGKLPLNFEKMKLKLLKEVPKKYIIRLNIITIVNKLFLRKLNNPEGVYFSRTIRELPHIEIAIYTIYKGMPKFLFNFPFIAKILLASVLYHEIGHHNQTEFVSKENKFIEIFAEKFSNEQLKINFCFGLLF